MRTSVAGAIAVLLGVVGCGGSGSPISSTPPSSGPVFSGGTSSTLAPSNGVVTIPLPAAGGFGGAATTTVPVADQGITVQTTLSAAPPQGAPPLTVRRHTSSLPPHTSLVYICLTFSADVATNGPFTLNVAIPPVIQQQPVQWYLAEMQGTSWIAPFVGPVAAVNNNLTFVTPGSLAFLARVPFCFAIYSTPPLGSSPGPTTTPSTAPSSAPSSGPSTSPSPGATASPSPGASAAPTASPTATPTAPPPGVLSVNPTAVQVFGTGAGNAQPISVTETGYSGTFGETDTCSGIATVTTSSASGPAATYSVVGVAAGTCHATFSDSFSQQHTAAITVTTSGFTIQSRGRKDH